MHTPRGARRSRPDIASLLLLTAAVGAAAALWRAPGTSDVQNWRAWIENARFVGPLAGYAANGADYPPGAALALFVAAETGSALGLDILSSIKLLTASFLFATTAAVWWWSRRAGLAAMTQASLVLSAIGLVYLDVLVAPFVVIAMQAAGAGAPFMLVSAVAAACFMKWQPLLIVPFVMVYLRARFGTLEPAMRRRERALLFLLVFAIVVAVLGVYGWQIGLALARAGRHGGLSNNAANLPWIFGWALRLWSPDVYGALWQGTIADITQGPALLRAALRAASLAAYAFALLVYARTRSASASALCRYALAGSLAYFLLHPGAHENHLFLSGVLAIALAAADPRWTRIAAVINTLAAANLAAFYGATGAGRRFAIGIDVTVWLAAIMCAAGGWIIVLLFRRAPPPDAHAAPRAHPRTAPTGTD